MLGLAVGVLLLALLNSMGGSAAKTERKVVQHDEWLDSSWEAMASAGPRIERLKSGDSAGLALVRLGFSPAETAKIIQAAKAVYALRNVHAGHKFIRLSHGTSEEVSYQISADKQLKLILEPNQEWRASIETRQLLSQTRVLSGVIEDSLFWDAVKIGMPDSLTMQLVDLFAWDIDFARDLRKGDAFKVMFDESFDDAGQHVAYTILAAEFINRGQRFSGIRYHNSQGEIEYFSDDGRNLRKTYLKSPVKYSRISSRFRSSRKHPVLGYTRAHRGVDYAAKTGTPIRAIGDGKVVFKGWKGGYGRFVKLRHNNGIHTTGYAHMRQYGKNLKRGDHVKQGQIIGYVGMSGLATGPHLHFEFRSRGRAVNPLSIKHKAAKSIAKEEMEAFKQQAEHVLGLMMVNGQSTGWG